MNTIILLFLTKKAPFNEQENSFILLNDLSQYGDLTFDANGNFSFKTKNLKYISQDDFEKIPLKYACIKNDGTQSETKQVNISIFRQK